MKETFAVVLEGRGVLRLDGPDLRSFLQGIVSTDMSKVSPERSLWSAFLTPQGKFLHEFFVSELDGAFLLDCEADRRGDLMQRLGRYRLRSKVSIKDGGADYAVAALFGDDALPALGLPDKPGRAKAFAGGVVYVDPRLSALGARAVVPRARLETVWEEAGVTLGEVEAYDRLRISLGVPDGSRDLEVEKSILLENGFEELQGVDWDKGCFMGQELTARTKYRALIKKRLLPVAIEGPVPAPGTAIRSDGKEVGVMRSAAGSRGLALLRIEALGSGALTAGDARLTAHKPDWVNF